MISIKKNESEHRRNMHDQSYQAERKMIFQTIEKYATNTLLSNCFRTYLYVAGTQRVNK